MRISIPLALALGCVAIAMGGPVSAASPQWTRTAHLSPSDTRYNDLFSDIATDGGGVVGLTQLETRSGETAQLTLRRYSASGALRWKRDLDKVAYGVRDGGSVAVDGAGIFVAFPRPSTWVLRKVRASDGATRWSRDVTALVGGFVRTVDIAAHAGDLFVAVCWYSETTYDHATILRLDGADGDVVGGPWNIDNQCYGAIHVAVTEAAIHAINETVVAERVFRLDHDGTKRWTRRLPEGAAVGGIVADAGGAYAAYTRYRAGDGAVAYLRRIAPDGEVRWTERALIRGTQGGNVGEPTRDRRGVYLGWMGYDKDDNDPVLGVRRYSHAGAAKATWIHRTTKLNLLRGLAVAGGELYAGGRGRSEAVLHRLPD